MVTVCELLVREVSLPLNQFELVPLLLLLERRAVIVCSSLLPVVV
ncbi:MULTISPECIES: hypothetical protein [unclassified Microcoleus]|nr:MULTISPECIES: hypothetical protein [unclassified Microcoleus]